MKPAVWAAEMLRSGYSEEFPIQARRVVSGILNGVDVEFTGDRTAERYGENLRIDDDHFRKVDDVIRKDVLAGKKAGPFEEAPFPHFVVSPIGAVPKKQAGKIRVIHHLSYPFKGDSINASVVDEYLPLQRFANAACAVRDYGPGCWLIKLDVEAAYKQVPVRHEDWPLLGFKWLGKFYYERVLPFGLKSSCRIWDWYAAVLHYFFEQWGLGEVIHYIDDFLFVAPSREIAEEFLRKALDLCKRLGIPMADDKTEGPVHCLTFLGIELDTIRMIARLNAERLEEIRRLTRDWLGKSQATQKELQSLAGLLTFAASVVRPGRHFVGGLFKLAAAMEAAHVPRSHRWCVSAEIRDDIAWWRDFLPQWNGISLLYERQWLDAPRIEFFTDSCGTGYGAIYGNEWFAGTWSDEWLDAAWRKSGLSMPFLELFTTVAAALTWGHKWAGKKITFRTDAEASMYAINGKTAKDAGMAHLLRMLARHACLHQYDFRAVHVAGVENGVADELSRFGDSPKFRLLCPQAAAQPTPMATMTPPRPSANTGRRPPPGQKV